MSGFGQVDIGAIENEEARLNGGNGDTQKAEFSDQFIQMPNVKAGETGTIALRILPPKEGGPFFQYNRTHKVNGRSVQCPRPLVNGKYDRSVPCPLCDYYSYLWKQIEQLEKQYGKDCVQAKPLRAEANAIKPTERYYYNAIARKHLVNGKEETNVGPRILSVGKTLHHSIIRAITGIPGDPDSRLGNIADLQNGYDFIIRKTVTAGDEYPKYDNSAFARSASPAGSPDEINRWAESLRDLTALRNPKGLEELERELAIHRGLIQDKPTGSLDVDAFDAKFKTSDSAPVGVTSTAKVTESAPAPTTKVVETTLPTMEETEAEDFLKQIESMGS